MDHAATPIPIVDLVSAATDSSCHAGVTTSMNASWPLLCYYHLSHITYPTKLKGIRELSAAVEKYRGSITWAWSHSTSISMCPFHPIHSIYTHFRKNRRVKKRLINHHFSSLPCIPCLDPAWSVWNRFVWQRNLPPSIMTAMLLAMPTLAWLPCPNLLANTALLSKRQANG